MGCYRLFCISRWVEMASIDPGPSDQNRIFIKRLCNKSRDIKEIVVTEGYSIYNTEEVNYLHVEGTNLRWPVSLDFFLRFI